MIKKHLITCSVILVLFIISKLFIFSVPDKKPLKNSGAISTFTNFLAGVKPVEEQMNFADEKIPLHNAKVNRKIRHSIWKHHVAHPEPANLQAKAKKWFPVIVPILRAYGIPEDFKYIPLLESGLNNRSVSPKGAAGFWQFMPQTAREYGLRVGKRRDERLNVRKSTIAACKYIKELYAQFDSWTLAAAAYNAGSPRVQHAINRKNGGNYYYMRLNRETGTYVYKLLAIKQAVKKSEEQHAYDTEYSLMRPLQTLAAAN
ncbi:lytic transglycosylase domain-containing protein [Mucilaginibacter lacusdianchii]|uniref:lytic transglycosylase domain-containing protein n=1 Tax=Mucilaginibacter lacusdianchii TaxID=2684211 RepID=UPI00131A6E61|nr:lytic transglycosylase domain-containing protein [Mucilaginibacter sp. JXJ CY 39]